MKVIYFLFLLLLPQSGFGQSAVDQTIKAIKAGDVTEMAKDFDKVVDVTINNEQSAYSESQATVVLKNFFSRNKIKSFIVKHKGSPADNSSVYIIGDLTAEPKKSYRLYLFFKQKDDGLLLQEIRIEE